MEIIRRGTPPSEIKWRGTCSQCKSIMECKEGEVHDIYEGDQREPGRMGKAACPVCSAIVNFYPVSRR